MRVRIIVVGRLKNDFIKQGVLEFEKRIKPMLKVETKEVKQGSIEEEADRIFKLAPGDSKLIVLSEEGRQFSSESFSKLFGFDDLCFVIGGTFGVSESLKKRADIILSLSKMTFTHEMARLLLLEQIYRAQTILKNIKYHK